MKFPLIRFSWTLEIIFAWSETVEFVPSHLLHWSHAMNTFLYGQEEWFDVTDNTLHMGMWMFY